MCFAIICLILVLLVLSEVVVLAGFSRVEYQSAQKDTNRVVFSLVNDINTLDAIAQDWASRDDTRTFLLTTKSPASWYRLDPDTFEGLQFNYILLMDANGTLISGKGYDLSRHTEKPVPPDLATLLSSDQQIATRLKTGSDTMGVLPLPEGPLMVAICPVFSDQDKRQVIGYIIMGRNLDATEVSRLSSMAQLPLELQPYHSASLPADFITAIPQLPLPSSPFIQRDGENGIAVDAPNYIMPVGSNLLGTYSLICDISDQPVLILKVSIVRDIYDQGVSTTLYFVSLLIIAGLVFGIAILILLEKTVLSRILNLSRRLNEIGKRKDFSARVVMNGEDEIGALTDNVNGMLGELEISRNQLQGRLIQSEEKYRLFFNSITDPVIIFRAGEPDTFTRIIEANDAATVLLGYSHEELIAMSPAAIMVMDVHEENPALFQQGGTAGFIQYESSYRARDGKLIPVEINARVFDEFGQRAILLIARDITDRKMAEKALMQAHKKLNLLNIVTFNDIQNALFALRGFVNLKIDPSADTKTNVYLEKEEVILRRISGSLDFAKKYQDLGTKPPRWQDVNGTFIMGISHLDFSSIHREVCLDNLEIYADPLLERVFFTFADNVLHHAKTATQVTIRYQLDGDMLILFLEDNGNGIPDTLKEKIFERGSGTQNSMELFLAREILEITGITIRETGICGNGARFEIRVPRGSFRFMGKEG